MFEFNLIVARHPRQPVEMILKGSREELTDIIQVLHVMGFVEICEWCRFVPNKQEGNFITLISRHKQL